MKNKFTTTLLKQLLPVIIFVSIVCNTMAQNPETTKYIVVDQFGYLPNSRKVAVIRDPQIGFDSEESFAPGSLYAVVHSETKERVFSAAPVSWKNGQTDTSSGDKAWWFDFSLLKEVGKYYILDVDSNLRSYEFEIRTDIYEEVMVQAVRAFYYQRAGFAKQPPFACEEWADGASHLQDKNARNFLDKNNAKTEVDVSGGWYDAGDYNKYTSWTSDYIVEFMKAFMENPGVWGDDYNIPESGNNIPDILDEAKWGVDHLLRLQQANGSMLSVVGLAHASPPSAAKGPSYYGLPNTSGTLNASAAFAFASKVYKSVGLRSYADSLQRAAIKAWDWADENPNVLFYNNTGNTSGLAAGQQEVDDYGRFAAKMKAAAYLFEITGEKKYQTFFESKYKEIHLLDWTFAYPFEAANQETLLYFASLPGVSSSVANSIKTTYKNAMRSSDNFGAINNQTDPYRAFLKDYTWGSNSIKARQGLMYTGYVRFGIDQAKNAAAMAAAEDFIHYLHGVNPLNMVYLSNMNQFGAENSVNEFYHSWFTDGSAKWDRVGESTYGPAPGFLTGGPNPGYDWDGCCPSGCGSAASNAWCTSESIAPPKGQPKQKSYKDFNTSWPLNSWEVTENSGGYQISYIRLLSFFLPVKYDCAGILDGAADYDICGICTGGTTGIVPGTSIEDCIPTAANEIKTPQPEIFPNPASQVLNVRFHSNKEYEIVILNSQGQKVLRETASGNVELNIQHLLTGGYVAVLSSENGVWQEKFVKL